VSDRADFWLRVLGAFVASLVLSPVFAVFLPGEQVHRIMTRTFQGTLVVLLLLRAGPPRTWRRKAQGLGARGPYRLRRLAAGALPAILVFSLLIWGSYLAGGRETLIAPSRLSFGERALKAVLAAVGVAYFEELLVRGYMKNVLGYFSSAFVFAVIHNFQPVAGSAPAGEGYDPLLAVKNLDLLVESWTDPHLALPGTLGLLIFAFLLNDMRDRSGTLLWGMGFHGGLVLCLALYRQWLEGAPSGPRWIFGGSRLYDGALGIGALLACWAAVRYVPLPDWLKQEAVRERQ